MFKERTVLLINAILMVVVFSEMFDLIIPFHVSSDNFSNSILVLKLIPFSPDNLYSVSFADHILVSSEGDSSKLLVSFSDKNLCLIFVILS